MRTVTEGQSEILKQARPLAAVNMPLAPSALGLVLAEEVASDIDMPPFDKALMDGYAFRFNDLNSSDAVFSIAGEIMAGQTADRPLAAREAARIMTGAPLPAGADTVVMVERTKMAGDNRVRIDDSNLRQGANVLLRAREMRCGQIVLMPGTVLGPAELGLLAAVGRASAKVYPRPGVAVLCTGDELVEAPQSPGPGQIRNGNGPMIAGLVSRGGGVPLYLGIAKDEMGHLRNLVRRGLESPVLVLSGGVSAGKRDLVPAALEELGVQAHFHKIIMKPGKPMFFGTRGDCLVLGLPGNPVSALVCFELFVRPALRVLGGRQGLGPEMVTAVVEQDFTYATDRPTYYPALVRSERGAWWVRMGPWFGSADLKGATGCNAFAVLPAGDIRLTAGESQEVLRTEY